jgi:hypothetical protein
MSAILPIDATSGQWRAVVSYIEARIEELKDVCCSTASADEQRRAAAHRIEELRELLSAPERTKQMTEHRLQHQPVEVY